MAHVMLKDKVITRTYISLSKSVGKETKYFNSKREHLMHVVKHLCTHVPSKFCLDMTKRQENGFVNSAAQYTDYLVIPQYWFSIPSHF